MAKAYQYYLPEGYYAGSVEDRGLLPGNSTYDAPDIIEGYIPRWTGSAWEQVEDHKGEEGYLDGQPHTIKDYGPVPDCWSTTPPPPTTEEKAAQMRAQRDGLIAGTDYLMMPDYPISDADQQAISEYRQALRDITTQRGFPDEVEWPEKPALSL